MSCTIENICKFFPFMIDEMLAKPVVISRKYIDIFARMPLREEQIQQVTERLAIITKHIHVITEKDDIHLVRVGIDVRRKFVEDGTSVFGVDVDIGDEEHGCIVEKLCVVARGVAYGYFCSDSHMSLNVSK